MRRTRTPDWWRAVRHRPAQAVALSLLAALVAAAATFAPLYVRAVGQVIVDLDLVHSPVGTTGLQISSRAGEAESAFQNYDNKPPIPPDQLDSLVTGSLRSDFGPAILDQEALPAAVPNVAGSLDGTLIARTDICEHLTFAQGRCPRAVDEVAISSYDRAHRGLKVGSHPVIGTQPDAAAARPHVTKVRLTVVGVYHQVPGDYWFGRLLTGKSGLIDPGSIPHTLHDDWVTVPATMTDPARPMLPQSFTSALLPINKDAAGLDQFRALGPALDRFDTSINRSSDAGQVSTYSGLPDLVKDLNHQLRQAAITVPLLMLQLGLLCLFVLWLVLGAVTEQRRPEVALALLRGRGRGGARRMLLAELGPVTASGVVIGTGLGLLLTWGARHFALPGAAPFEVTRGFWLALLVALLVVLVTTSIAVVRVSREPVETLLRRVATRRQGWRLGAVDTLLIAVAGTGAVAFLLGALAGSAALVGPALLALTVGLVLSHLVVPVAARLGGRVLARGRVRAGLSILTAARLPATRRTVALVTVATALLVFSADAMVVGAHNRQLAAEQYVGAPRVLTVAGTDLPAVRSALDEIDPAGHDATPVVTVQPPGGGATTTLAVVPEQFRKIALLDLPKSPPWQLLAPPAATPLKIKANAISASVHLTARGGSNESLTLGLAVVFADHSTGVINLGDLPTHPSKPVTLRAAAACNAGCLISGIVLNGLPGALTDGTFTLGALRVPDGDQTAIGPGANWIASKGSTGTMEPSSTSPARLQIKFKTEGSATLRMAQRWFPTSVPALVAGPLPDGSHGNDFAVAGLDAQNRAAVRVGGVARVPSAPARTAMVNLDTVARGSNIDTDDVIQVWLAHDDPTLAHRVEAALAKHNVEVQTSTSVSARRQHYDQSAAAWGLGLAIVTGALALLIALLVLAVLAVTGWRLRARDLAALRMGGLTGATLRLVAAAEQVVPVVLAVVVGAVSGTVGARLAMTAVPMFAEKPEVSTLDLSLSWPAILAATLAGLVVLSAGAMVGGRAIAARARLDRLRGAA